MLNNLELVILSLIIILLGAVIIGFWFLIFYLKKRKEIVLSNKETDLVDNEKTTENIESEKYVGSEYSLLAKIHSGLKIPLEGILGLTGQILDSDDLKGKPEREYWEFINKSTSLIEDIIVSISELSKIEKKQLILTFAECKLNKMLDELFVIFKKKSLEKGVEILVEKGVAEPDFSIYSDEKRIRQVLFFLINYAFQNVNAGNVKIGYKIENLFIMFFIETGTCNPEYLNELFSEEKPSCKGFDIIYKNECDLGLYMAKGIVENLDGKIWLDLKEANLETGDKDCTCFYFTLPFQGVKKNISKPREDVDCKDFVWKDKTILIVEDAIISFELLTKFLKNSQVNILYAADGLDAVNFCKENREIDLVLMDIQLPIMDGLEATSIIKEFRPGLSIIAQTANAMEEEKKNVIEAGCDDYISKPINRLELLQKINIFIGKV